MSDQNTGINICKLESDGEYYSALKRLNEIFDADIDTPEGYELEVLVDLIEEYEEKSG